MVLFQMLTLQSKPSGNSTVAMSIIYKQSMVDTGAGSSLSRTQYVQYTVLCKGFEPPLNSLQFPSKKPEFHVIFKKWS